MNPKHCKPNIFEDQQIATTSTTTSTTTTLPCNNNYNVALQALPFNQYPLQFTASTFRSFIQDNIYTKHQRSLSREYPL